MPSVSGAWPPIPFRPKIFQLALNMLNERVMAATYTSEEQAIPEDRVIDTLVHIWLASIYEDGQASAERQGLLQPGRFVAPG